MRLQRLELNGFKSFPDRSELRFDQGVTAIVGPNGCGKSNVVDAITWVLGEQSARSLRGDRMEDVIFSGSDARRPTAAAEVRLKLSGVTAAVAHTRGAAGNGNGNGHRRPDASAAAAGSIVTTATMPAPPDQDTGEAFGDSSSWMEEDAPPIVARDVELGRRLYRSGESEYLIDGEVCRLRDVHDLLMDAGVGVKAYAVIEQGKIGQILSARPNDRRQLIEEAAGVTKYKSRRHAAELRLEAAQQNLTRIDDIIFELDKQRGSLKRQASRAGRYRRLREELRQWEKVLMTHRYRHLAGAIDAARARLAAAREREQLAAARLAELEGTQERLRIELAEAESLATSARDRAHARELEIGRRQQQIVFDRQQAQDLAGVIEEMAAAGHALAARRGPVAEEIEQKRAAAAGAARDRAEAAEELGRVETEYAAARTAVEGFEGDVEAARSEVFAAINAATALQHALDHAAETRGRISETLGKLDVENHEVEVEIAKAVAERDAATEALNRAVQAVEATRDARAVRDGELASARIAHEGYAREIRQREQELAAMVARLTSLEELDAARAGYADAARLVLAESKGKAHHLGSVADYIEVDRRYERAVEAALQDLLQLIVVGRHEHAAAGLRFVRERRAGRCGFLVIEGNGHAPSMPLTPGSPVPLASVVRVSGPAAGAIARAMGQAWIVESLDEAAVALARTGGVVVTLDGDVLRGPHVVIGGVPAEARGLLATKREIKELRQQIDVRREDIARVSGEVAALQTTIGQAETVVAALEAEGHTQDKALVGLEMRVANAADVLDRLKRRHDLVAAERRSALEELAGLDARQAEVMTSLTRIEVEQRAADERLSESQRRLFEARESIDTLAHRAAEAKAVHAAWIERAAAMAGDVDRLEETARELEERFSAQTDELGRTRLRREALLAAVVESEQQLDADVRSFESLRERLREADERIAGLRIKSDELGGTLREARQNVDELRTEGGRLEVDRVTAEGELSHLAAVCADTLQATLDEIACEVESLEQSGSLRLDAGLAAESDEAAAAEESTSGEAGTSASLTGASAPSAARVVSVEEAITRLKAKIERLGPVNMMAIEQFDELEARFSFLTSQRKDLVDAIAQTAEAIRRIDRTTRERFRDAFQVINEHFQQTFSTLFGGGRAGLVLLDETDLLETGIDIVAQPPGKRLQNVMLLSGGEKALTAMALMFAIFRYRPSPFCLLDEIDAPLDDANIGRFVEMLRAMQRDTQFILITHNRKTMEIADRLYGVTMEEPGVSKLISVQLN